MRRISIPHFRASLLALGSSLDPTANGLILSPVRQEGLAASNGATDFGEYFTYFSFFIVAAALLLASLFFRLGVEQRLREIGLLRSVGFSARAVRNLFLKEGILLAVVGGILGIGGAVGYAWLMMYGLRNWWVSAVGTTSLTLDLRPLTLAIGVIAGVITAIVCLTLTVRSISRVAPRRLLTGEHLSEQSGAGNQSSRGSRILGISGLVAGIVAIVLLGGLAMGMPGQTAGFFVAGTLLLYASVSYWYRWFRSDRQTMIAGTGMWSLVRLGFRNASSRPGRSALCIALVAAATFIITAVDAFRREAGAVADDRKSGTGGYALIGESLLPIVINPQSESGRDELNLTGEPSLDGVTIERFRLKPGDDSSCLNLYRPQNPRILGAREEFIRENRFTFGDTLASTAEEMENPWRLLERESIDGAVPVIADANSITYVLHAAVGDEILVGTSNGAPLRLRVAAALSDSVLQSELVMSEKNFLRLFPDRQGYRFFLIGTPNDKSEAALTALEDRLSDFGFDGSSTVERLASYHRVESTYLSTFQSLGGLGLLLGTIGLGAVLARNVIERQRELAMLRSVGYQKKHFTVMVISENAILLVLGAVTGLLCALIATAPVLVSRGEPPPLRSILLPLLVVVVGLAASALALKLTSSTPLLNALRTE